MPTTNLSLVFIGKILKAHGLKGELEVGGRTDPIPLYYQTLMLCDASEKLVTTVRIKKSKKMREKIYVEFEEAGDRTLAEKFSGLGIYVERAQIQAVSHKTKELVWSDFYQREVIDRNQEVLGRVKQVYNCGATDILEILSLDHTQSIDLPLIDDYFDLSFTAPYDLNSGKLLFKQGRGEVEELWVKVKK